MDKWTVPGIIPTGRPIVSGCNSESAAVEEFIDYHLQPLASASPSFLRDSNHFKAIISNLNINASDFFVTFDVESLYTNIPIPEGLQAINLSLSNHPMPNRPDKYIMKLLEITLFRNDFRFADKTFLQIKGTAMGKKYAPSFANLFMHFWENNALLQSSLKPTLWKRYIDDIFCIWPHSLTDLVTFINILNSTNPNIKLTAKHSAVEIDFLDCTIFKSDKKTINTKIFFKETDSHHLLHPNSHHPKHIFKGIVKSQILRFIRLSSTRKDFHYTYRILKQSLIHLGYSRSMIRRCKLEAFKQVALLSNDMITGCRPCKHNQCRVCTHINTTLSVHGNTPNSLFLICQNTNCSTANCIYTLNCTLCTGMSTLYVGETQNSFRHRFNQHLSDIRGHKDTPIAHHFSLPNHNISNIRATVIQFFLPNSISDRIRKDKESMWIHKLGTQIPKGLNTMTQHVSGLIPLILPYSKTSNLLANRIKNLISHNHDLHEKVIPLTGFSNNRSLRGFLAPTKFV